MAQPPSDPLLSVRTTVILMLAVLVGLITGVIGYFAHHDIATAVLIGGGAAAGALVLFHGIIAR